MKLVRIDSELNELYRKKGPRELRKWRSRKRKGLEISRICGIGLDYHLVERYSRIAYDYIASSVIKIQKMEAEILHMYAIMEKLYLLGVVGNGYKIRTKNICIKLNVKDTAPLGSAPEEGHPHAAAYMMIESNFGGDLTKIKIDRCVRINDLVEVKAGASVTRIARTFMEALEDFPKFKDYFIQEVTTRIIQAK